MEKIDFVILWVDGNDGNWLKEKNKYMVKKDKGNSNNRFRDWDLLRYWFRGIENYAPWVNKIHFITYGHIPNWLNTENPKINIVKHEEFMPKEILPTFNSNVIQYYLKDIEGLTERFVLFDDDMFLLKPVNETDFFIGDKICDEYGENIIFPSYVTDPYPHSMLNNIQVVNENYNKKKVYSKNFFKYINFKYGFWNNIRTLLLLGWSNFVGFYHPHICQSYTKKHCELFWKYGDKLLKENIYNRFRANNDLTTFLIRDIALLEGDFVPRKHSFGMRMELHINNDKIYKTIKNRKYSVLCINDSDESVDFEKTKNELKNAFEQILPKKSDFEK